ncbi:DUF2849 domain-containing protein [Roseibium litorale]|uniref:DUF2849 domain-containing protein n=1 Tax=Roseibium litorale TaxID=2803841 RepID=A0ABR9CMZ8_9HYPH|nr:DUF2849 domain-containing protein [Roseibium litorale]MBD8892222.1 DUF2849 domain-containing protein [Roseibium litorale]
MKIVTANRLIDGEVVWLGAGNAWVGQVSEALVLDGKDDVAAALAAGLASAERREVVDVYEVDVTEEDGKLVPVRLREKIRAKGPTTHPDLGKQAQAVNG